MLIHSSTREVLADGVTVKTGKLPKAGAGHGVPYALVRLLPAFESITSKERAYLARLNPLASIGVHTECIRYLLDEVAWVDGQLRRSYETPLQGVEERTSLVRQRLSLAETLHRDPEDIVAKRSPSRQFGNAEKGQEQFTVTASDERRNQWSEREQSDGIKNANRGESCLKFKGRMKKRWGVKGSSQRLGLVHRSQCLRGLKTG
jgi:hypothetical protein